MSIISILAASLLFKLNYGQPTIQLCEQNPCDFTVEPEAILVCGCDVNNCLINVEETDQGKELLIYTYARNTVLNCRESNGCQGAIIRAGDDMPPINISTICNNPGRSGIRVNCDEVDSCKDMNITSDGYDINVIALNENSFDESSINCLNSNCKLNCSDTQLSCEGAICGNNCLCNGLYCPGWTTPAPVAETTEPVTTQVPGANQPIPSFDTSIYRRCLADEIDLSGKCILSPDLRNPNAKNIIVVTNSEGINELEIRCLENEECKDNNGPLTIYSAAPITTILCGEEGAESSCSEALAYIGSLTGDQVPQGFMDSDFSGIFDSVNIRCNGKDSCKEMNTTIVGKFNNNPMLTALDEKAYSESLLDCDDLDTSMNGNLTCKLLCDEQREACDQAICGNNCMIGPIPQIEIEQISNMRFAKRVAITNVVGEPGGLVILPNNNENCIIDCSGVDQCKKLNGRPFRVFSGCNSTTIICGQNSCKEAEINVGELVNGLPVGFGAMNFEGKKTSLILDCNGYGSCYRSNVNIVGDFIINSIINAAGENSLKDASVTCSQDECIFNCNSRSSCDKTTLNCDLTNNCECNFECSSLSPQTNLNAVDINTRAPTLQTSSPTGQPTPTPTNQPTPSPTSSELIIYKPNQSGVFICKNNVNNCILDCNDVDSQCDQKTILLSAANNTVIQCDKKDACKMIKVYLGLAVTNGVLSSNQVANDIIAQDFINTNAYSALINCSGMSACYKADINVLYSLSDSLQIETRDFKDSLKDAQIKITLDALDTCEIECGSMACKDTKFQGTTGLSCGCLGTSCPTQLLRQSNVNHMPQQNNIPNAKSVNGKHYPTFLPTAIIVIISFALICIMSFCIYNKYFSKKQKQNERMLGNNFGDYHNNGKYDTFQADAALEMNNFA